MLYIHTYRYDEDSETWLLSSLQGSVNGSSVASISSMGTGAQTWQFDRDICGTNSLPPMPALMTVCSLEQFTCLSDGACISMEKRCDQFPNCQDFSDEDNCKVVFEMSCNLL